MTNRRIPSWVALALIFAFAPNLVTGAAKGTEGWVILRVHQAGGDIAVEAPRDLLSNLAQEPSGATFSIGQFKGKSVRVSADRLVRMLRDAGSKEGLLFIRQTDSGPVAFYASASSRPAPERGGTPLMLAFDMTRKGASPVNILLPLIGSATIGTTILSATGLQAGSDAGPLIESVLEAAEKLGTGPFLRATASDAQISATLR